MEEHGIVSRFVHPVVPPKVEYSVTTLGFSLSPICKQLCDWGEKHLKEEETNNQKINLSKNSLKVAKNEILGCEFDNQDLL